jgi:hypothetical protein
VQISAISSIMSFRKHGHEDIDQCLARLDVAFFKAEADGGAQFLPPVKAWMTLSIMRIPADRWTVLLAPTEGRLPATDPELAAFNQYLRRHGHMERHNNTDQQKTITQHFFMDGQPTDANSTWDHQFNAPAMNMHGYPVFGQDQQSADVDPDYMSVSSAESLESQDVDWSDCAQGSNDANLIGESIYLAYRHAKRKWRQFSGPKRKRFFKRPSDAPHTASKTIIKKKYRTLPKPYFVSLDQLYFGAPQAHPKGGGKRPFVRSGNPYDSAGKQLECSICHSKEHFRANCP